MRVAVYARVSSQIQRDKHTIASQLSTLPEAIVARGWTVAGEPYVDDGKTAKTGHLEKRDGLAQLQLDARAGLFEAVAVVDIDRFTRSRSMLERGQIYGPLQDAGVRIFISSTGQVLDLNSDEGDLLLGVGNMQSASWLAKHRERIMRGKLEAIRQGRKPAGPTPFGLIYDRPTHAWSIDPELAPIVVELFERVAAGESCETLARELHGRGVRRARGGLWDRERVWQIVTSRTYIGEWTADRARRLVVPVPAIVTADLYEAAQTALKRHGKRGLRRTKGIYLCDDQIAYCALCQAPIGISNSNGYKGGKRQRYYVCVHRRRPPWHGERCTFPMRHVEEVDARVWDAVCEALRRPDYLEGVIALQRAQAQRGASDHRKDLQDAERALARLQRSETALLERFSRGLISDGALDAELQRMAKERRLQAQQVETAKRQGEGARQELARGDLVLATLATLRSRLDAATPAERRELVHILVPQRGVELGAGPGGPIGVTLVVNADPPVALARAAGSRTQHESNRLVLKVVA